MRKFFKEFKDFINKGNVIDLAVALAISTAFTAIVNALVNSVIMPLVTAIFGKVDVTDLSFTINNSIIPVGVFVQAIINFLMITFFLFLIIRAINKTKSVAEKEKSKKVTKEEKEEIKALGTVDMKDKKAVYAAALELRNQKQAEKEETEAKAKAEAETTENLLKQIRDLLIEQKSVKTKSNKKED